MSERSERVKKLADAVEKYATNEKTRIENEVKVLEAILKGRTGAAGVQQSSTDVVEAVAKFDLKSYLEGS